MIEYEVENKVLVVFFLYSFVLFFDFLNLEMTPNWLFLFIDL